MNTANADKLLKNGGHQGTHGTQQLRHETQHTQKTRHGQKHRSLTPPPSCQVNSCPVQSGHEYNGLPQTERALPPKSVTQNSIVGGLVYSVGKPCRPSNPWAIWTFPSPFSSSRIVPSGAGGRPRCQGHPQPVHAPCHRGPPRGSCATRTFARLCLPPSSQSYPCTKALGAWAQTPDSVSVRKSDLRGLQETPHSCSVLHSASSHFHHIPMREGPSVIRRVLLVRGQIWPRNTSCRSECSECRARSVSFQTDARGLHS